MNRGSTVNYSKIGTGLGRSSVIDGAARIFDFQGGIGTRHLRFLHRSDEDALREDWEAIGGDLWSAIGIVAGECGASKEEFDELLSGHRPMADAATRTPLNRRTPAP